MNIRAKKIIILVTVVFVCFGGSYALAKKFRGGEIYDPKAEVENQLKADLLKKINNLKQELNDLVAMSTEILNIPQHFKDVQNIVFTNLKDRFNEGIFSEENSSDKLQAKSSSVKPYFTEGGLDELYSDMVRMKNETIIAASNKTSDLQELEREIQNKSVAVTVSHTKSKLAENQKSNLLDGMDAKSKDNASSLKMLELKMQLAKSIKDIQTAKIASFSNNTIMFSDPSEQEAEEKRVKRLRENGVDPYKLPSFK